jgi:hypothetical protein
MRRLNNHANIAQVYDFIPAISNAIRMDEFYIEHCRAL